MEVLYKTKKVEAIYHPKENYFYFNWIGFQNKASLIENGTKLIDVFGSKMECAKILNDNSKVTGPWQDAADWVVTEWFPAMEKCGLKQFAWIFSNNIFAELSAKKVSLNVNSDIVRPFHSMNEAKIWLLGKQSVNA